MTRPTDLLLLLLQSAAMLAALSALLVGFQKLALLLAL